MGLCLRGQESDWGLTLSESHFLIWKIRASCGILPRLDGSLHVPQAGLPWSRASAEWVGHIRALRGEQVGDASGLGCQRGT